MIEHTATAAPAVHAALRAATAGSHEQVDAAFARFDLTDAVSYGAFLAAHARVLPPIESALRGRPDLPDFAPRAPELAADLAALGQPMPSPVEVTPPASLAEAWGMLYVIEGSRLGGVMLARGVPEGLPKAYLSAAHTRGGWRALLQSLDTAAVEGGDAWLEEAIAAARTTFDRYAAVAHAAG